MTVVDCAVDVSESGKRERRLSMIERVTLILDAFDASDTQSTLEDLERGSGLPRSTVHRILDQLIRLDWVERAPLGYRLGRRTRGSRIDPEHDRIRAAAAPVLHRLALHTGTVAHLTVLDGRETVYLDKIGGRTAASVPSRVGGRCPAHANAGGKAMLTWLPAEYIDGLFRPGLHACTERTITDLDALHRELGRIRLRRGLAFESDESVQGIACVGAAIRGDSGPMAGISLCGNSDSIQLERLAPLVAAAAREVARVLYPNCEPRRESWAY